MEKNNDFDFKFKHKMVKNVPFFREIDDYIIQKIVYLLKPRFYDKDSVIVKQGDEVDRIYLLRSGSVVIDVKNPKKPK